MHSTPVPCFLKYYQNPKSMSPKLPTITKSVCPSLSAAALIDLMEPSMPSLGLPQWLKTKAYLPATSAVKSNQWTHSNPRRISRWRAMFEQKNAEPEIWQKSAKKKETLVHGDGLSLTSAFEDCKLMQVSQTNLHEIGLRSKKVWSKKKVLNLIIWHTWSASEPIPKFGFSIWIVCNHGMPLFPGKGAFGVEFFVGFIWGLWDAKLERWHLLHSRWHKRKRMAQDCTKRHCQRVCNWLPNASTVSITCRYFGVRKHSDLSLNGESNFHKIFPENSCWDTFISNMKPATSENQVSTLIEFAFRMKFRGCLTWSYVGSSPVEHVRCQRCITGNGR